MDAQLNELCFINDVLQALQEEQDQTAKATATKRQTGKSLKQPHKTPQMRKLTLFLPAVDRYILVSVYFFVLCWCLYVQFLLQLPNEVDRYVFVSVYFGSWSPCQAH